MKEKELYNKISEHIEEISNLLAKYKMRIEKPYKSRHPPKDYYKTSESTNMPLLTICARVFGIPVEQIVSGYRGGDSVLARHAYHHIRYRVQKSNYEKIGHELGRNRTTVLYSVHKADDLLCFDKKFKEKYNEILKQMYDVPSSP